MKTQMMLAMAMLFSVNSAWSMSCDPLSKNCVQKSTDAAMHATNTKRTLCPNLAQGRLSDVDKQFRVVGVAGKNKPSATANEVDQ